MEDQRYNSIGTDKLMNTTPILALAPMAGITDWPMRTLCAEQGCNYATTEMISAMGYLQAPKDSVVYRYLLSVGRNEKPPVVQIFGHDPFYLSEAAKRLTNTGWFSGIDINMGCPAPKVTGSGSGSALMQDLPLCARIIDSVRNASSLPLSIKIRLGWDPEHITAPELAHIAEDNGADLLTIHGRTRAQQYSGTADWQPIADICRSVSIPVLLNGDIDSASSALKALQTVPCAGLAIGRGALGNPFIFSQIISAINGLEYKLPSINDIVDTAIRHAYLMLDWKGEHGAVIEMRKHMCWYIHGRPGSAKLRTAITTAETLTDVCALLNAFRQLDPEQFST